MPSIKDLFKQFAFGYIAAGHTQTDESEAELKRLIAEWCDDLNEEDCFDRNAMFDILDYVEDHMTDDNKFFYRYNLNDFTYTCHLEKFIKYAINICNKNNK